MGRDDGETVVWKTSGWDEERRERTGDDGWEGGDGERLDDGDRKRVGDGGGEEWGKVMEGGIGGGEKAWTAGRGGGGTWTAGGGGGGGNEEMRGVRWEMLEGGRRDGGA